MVILRKSENFSQVEAIFGGAMAGMPQTAVNTGVSGIFDVL